MSRSKLVTDISRHMNMRPDFVEMFVQALVDVAVEQITNSNEPFKIPGLFTVKKIPWKGAVDINNHQLKDHYRLKVSINETVRKLYKLKQNAPHVEITKDNWRRILDTAWSPDNTLSTGTKSAPMSDDSSFAVESGNSSLDSLMQDFWAAGDDE